MNISIAGQEIQIRINDPELESLLMGNDLAAETTSADGGTSKSTLHPVMELHSGLSARYVGDDLKLQVSLENLIYLMRMRPEKSELVGGGEPRVRLSVD